MILACGIPSERSLKLVIDQLRERGASVMVLNQREFARCHIDFRIQDGRVDGELRIGDEKAHLADFAGVFTRLMDYRSLPELEGDAVDPGLEAHCQALHSILNHWFDIAPIRVLNRTQEVGVSYSKPLQSQWIHDHGFLTPSTLVTNEPAIVRGFLEEHGSVIYKSMSYVRSIVRMLDEKDLGRLEAVRACPVQFQEFIPGTNLRVHTVGDAVFATAIAADSVDYRYAYQAGESEQLEATTIDDDFASRCVSLARAFGLEFAGIDFRITPDGDPYCLEVNAAPAFSYYELHTGQPIAAAVADHLLAV